MFALYYCALVFRNKVAVSQTFAWAVLANNRPLQNNVNIILLKMSEKVTLYGFWASSATWRLRVALKFKEIDFEEKSIDIVGNDKEWEKYQKKVNPLGFVPALKIPQISEEKIFWYVLSRFEFDFYSTLQSTNYRKIT